MDKTLSRDVIKIWPSHKKARYHTYKYGRKDTKVVVIKNKIIEKIEKKLLFCLYVRENK